jgi:hypothetical protein
MAKRVALVVWGVVVLFCPRAFADHSFPTPEEFDEPGDVLGGAVEIKDEVVLLGDAGLYSRVPLGTLFLDDPVLPVSDDLPGEPPGEEKELRWASVDGDDETLALTPDTVEGNYPSLGVTMETYAAAAGELQQGAQPGVLARYDQSGGFYLVRADIAGPIGAFEVTLKVGRHQGFLVDPVLDEFLTPPTAGPFAYDEGENLRIKLEVNAPDGAGVSQVCGILDRVYVRDGVLRRRQLGVVVGRDDDLHVGRAGIYASAGTILEAIEIGYDAANLRVVANLSVPCLVPRLRDVVDGVSTAPQDQEMAGLNEDVNLRWKLALLRKADRAAKTVAKDKLPRAARVLQKIRVRVDGSPEPSDWILGAKAAAIVAQIDEMLVQLP